MGKDSVESSWQRSYDLRNSRYCALVLITARDLVLRWGLSVASQVLAVTATS